MVVDVYPFDGEIAVGVSSDHGAADVRIVHGGFFEQGLSVSEAAEW